MKNHFHCFFSLLSLGTKSDLRHSNEEHSTKSSDGHALKRDIKADAFLECSSKFMYNIDAVFQEAFLTHIRHNKMRKPSKSTNKKRSSCSLL